MKLTASQLLSIKSFIESEPALSAQPLDGVGLRIVADYLNSTSAGFIVWRTNISRAEVVSKIIGAEYVALSLQKQNAVSLLLSTEIIDASQPGIREHVQAIFAADGQTIQAVAIMARRVATVAEKILAVGPGTMQEPATLLFEGELDANQVDQARRAQ